MDALDTFFYDDYPYKHRVLLDLCVCVTYAIR